MQLLDLYENPHTALFENRAKPTPEAVGIEDEIFDEQFYLELKRLGRYSHI